MIIYGVLITIHIIVSFILIAVILLQAGRGGGLSEMFGGGSTQTIFGAKASVFLIKATAAAAIIFICTSMTLAVLSSKRQRSIMEGQKIEEAVPPATETTPKAEAPAAEKSPEEKPTQAE